LQYPAPTYPPLAAGEAGDGDGREGFHLCPRSFLDPHPTLDAHAARGVRRELEVDVHERERMTERSQVRPPLRGHDAREARDPEHVPLGQPAGRDPRHRLRPHDDFTARHSLPERDRLRGDIDDASPSAPVDVDDNPAKLTG